MNIFNLCEFNSLLKLMVDGRLSLIWIVSLLLMFYCSVSIYFVLVGLLYDRSGMLDSMTISENSRKFNRKQVFTFNRP